MSSLDESGQPMNEMEATSPESGRANKPEQNSIDVVVTEESVGGKHELKPTTNDVYEEENNDVNTETGSEHSPPDVPDKAPTPPFHLNTSQPDPKPNEPIEQNIVPAHNSDDRESSAECASPSPERRVLDNPDGFGDDFDWESFKTTQNLTEQVKYLEKEVTHKNKEILKLEDALTTIHEELKFLENQDVQVVAKDLARKNRQLTVQLQRERTKTAALQLEIERHKQEIGRYSHHHMSPRKMIEPLSFSERQMASSENATDESKATKDAESETENWKQKCSQATHKICDLKNENARLKGHIKKVELALRRETGTDLPIEELLKQGSHWKGRAEQISLLQSKLYDLRTERDSLRGTKDVSMTTGDEFHERHKQELSAMAEERAREYERAVQESRQCQQEMKEMKNLVKVKNSRIRGIEQEMTRVRNKLKFFQEKSANDDKLIEQLEKHLEQEAILKRSVRKAEHDMSASQSKIEDLEMIVASLESQRSHDRRVISSLETQVTNLRSDRRDRLLELMESFQNDERNYQIEVVRSERDRYQELVKTYGKNVQVLQKKLTHKKKLANKMDEASSEELPRSKTKLGKLNALKEKVKHMEEEQELLKASYLSIIDGKEQEVDICRNLLREVKDQHERALSSLRRKVDDIQQQWHQL